MKINGKKLHDDVKASPFNFAQVCLFIGKNSTFFNDVLRRNSIKEEDLIKVTGLIGTKPEGYQLAAPTPPPVVQAEPPKTTMRVLSPEEHKARMTSRTDTSQDWQYNTYLAVENGNDLLRELHGELTDNTNGIRGLYQLLREQNELLRKVLEIMK